MIRTRHPILCTVESIVRHIELSWCSDDLNFVRTSTGDPFGLIARRIRNEFGLWKPEHPLTAAWHSFPNDRDIRDGIDYSLNHPDEVSASILKALRKSLQ